MTGGRPRRPVAALRAAWGLLTVLGGAAPPHPGAAGAYGAVGAVLGAIIGGAWWALAQVLPPLVAAAVVVALDAALTGLLHLDGLADCGDGLLAPMDRERRLAVLRTPDVGAFGAVVVGLALLLRTTALASMPASPVLLMALYAASRGAAAAIGATVPYARAGVSLGGSYAGRSAHAVGAVVGAALAFGTAVLGGWTAPGGGWALARAASILAAVVAGWLGAAAVAALARRRLGGYTGDVLGAAIVTSEVVALVVAAGLG